MRKTLEKLIATTILTTSILSNPINAQEEILAIGINSETMMNTASKPREGPPQQALTLLRHYNDDPDIAELGKEVREIPSPLIGSTDVIIGLEASDELPGDIQKRMIGIFYENTGIKGIPNRFKNKLPLSTQYLCEDRNNTHIYAIIPTTAHIDTHKQMISGRIRTEGMDHWDVNYAVPSTETKLYELAIEINKYTRDKRRVTKTRNPLDELFKKGTRKIPGITGIVVRKTEQRAELELEKAEEERQKALRAQFGEKYKVIKLPLYEQRRVEDAMRMGTGRMITAYINHTSRNEILYIAIPQLTFRSRNPNIDATTEFRDILITNLADQVKFSYKDQTFTTKR